MKSLITLIFMMGSLSVFASDCNNCSREIMRACKDFTGSYSNEGLCIRLRSNPQVTEGCRDFTSSDTNEALCLRLQVKPYDAETCYLYTSSDSNQAQCLRDCAKNY